MLLVNLLTWGGWGLGDAPAQEVVPAFSHILHTMGVNTVWVKQHNSEKELDL